MNPKTTYSPAGRLARLLAGSTVAAICIGGGVAAAQVPLPGDPSAGEETPTTTTSTTTTTTPEPDAVQQSATEEGTTEERAGSLRLLREEATPNKIFFVGVRRAKFEYKIDGGRADLRIEAVRSSTGEVLRTWRRNDVQPNTLHILRWDGTRGNGDGVPKGRYYFRVRAEGGQSISRKRAVGERNIKVYPAKFPVRGPHQYWDGWGAGRGHEGQDIGAACGTKMQVARAGRVAWKSYDGGGWGHYVVINIKGQDRAHLYSHLQGESSLRRDERVETGQKLGFVGQSGNASGCHLHFELWKGSWGNGGPVPSVTKHMKAWDSWS